MPIAEPGGVARGCSQRSGTGGAAAEGGVRAARGSVRAARGECPRRPGKPAAATGEASRGDRGSQPRRPGKPAAATGGGPRRAGVFAEARETYPRRPGTCPRRPGTCPRRPAGVLSAATGRGSVRGNRRGSAEADRFAASPTYLCRPGAVLAARGSPAYSRRSMTSSM